MAKVKITHPGPNGEFFSQVGHVVNMDDEKAIEVVRRDEGYIIGEVVKKEYVAPIVAEVPQEAPAPKKVKKVKHA